MTAALAACLPVRGMVAATCVAIGISRASLQRLRSRRAAPPLASQPRAKPARALTAPQQQAVLDMLHAPRFADQAPAEIYASLLDGGGGTIASFTADGAYDRDDVYAAVAARSPRAAVVIPPRSSAVVSASENAKPTPRDAHIAAIAAHGRMGWQRRSGYNWRALVEADVSRWKRVIGDGLRSRTNDRRATEVAIAARALNRMLKLGRPEYLRTA